MNSVAEKLVVVEANPVAREALLSALQAAGYTAAAFATPREALEALRQAGGADLILLAAASSVAGVPDINEAIAAIRGPAATERLRVMVLVGSDARDRAAALDLGADDAISLPWDAAELLARVRAQLRARRADRQLLEKAEIAEEGQKIAHTAFDALAVTEKMTRDAFSLDRRLKFGLTAVLIVAVVMAAIYFLFAHTTQKDLQRTTAIIARLERGLVHQEDLMAQESSCAASRAPRTLRCPRMRRPQTRQPGRPAAPLQVSSPSMRRASACCTFPSRFAICRTASGFALPV